MNVIPDSTRCIEMDIETNIQADHHTITMRVPTMLNQKLCNHREEYAYFLIHGKYGLQSMYLINYPIYIPLLTAFMEYQPYVKNKGIGKKRILAKFDGYTMEIVQLKTTIDKPKMKHGDYLYACTPNGLDRKQRETRGDLRQIRRLGPKSPINQTFKRYVTIVSPDNSRCWYWKKQVTQRSADFQLNMDGRDQETKEHQLIVDLLR
jgi:hypothetical protein